MEKQVFPREHYSNSGCSIKLWELLIGVAILGLLATIAIPDFLKTNGIRRPFKAEELAAFYRDIEKGDAIKVNKFLSKYGKFCNECPNCCESRDRDRDVPVSFAIKHGKLGIVELILRSGVNVDEFGLGHCLHLAVRQNSLSCVRMLVRYGAKVSVYDEDLLSPMNLASDSGQDEIYQFLLSHETNPSICDDASLGRTEVVIARIKEDPSLVNQVCGDPKDPRQWPRAAPLQFAAAGGHIDTVTALLGLGANPKPGLDLAIRLNRTEIFKSLVEAMVDFDFSGQEGQNAVDLAVEVGAADILRLLLEKGVDINKNSGRVLLRATRKENPEVVQVLVDHGALLSANDQDKKAIFSTTGDSGNVEIARIILPYGIIGEYREGWIGVYKTNLSRWIEGNNPTYKPAYGNEVQDMMVRAVQKGNRELVIFLLEKQVNPDGFSPFSAATPLQMAASSGQTQICQILLDHGADIQAYNPLYSAAMAGHVETARFLIGRGADPCQPIRWEKKYALESAVASGHLEMIPLLKEHPCEESR